MNNEKTILFFGDSLIAGYGLQRPSLDSFPSVIREKIEAAGLAYKVINAGVSGETTAAGKNRIDLLLQHPMDVFILELGANDLLRGIPPSDTERNLQVIVNKVKSAFPAVKLVLLGLEIPSYIASEYARNFRSLFRRVAETNNMIFVPFLLDGVAGIPDLNLHDGFHPSEKGHAIIAETVWKAIKGILFIMLFFLLQTDLLYI